MATAQTNTSETTKNKTVSAHGKGKPKTKTTAAIMDTLGIVPNWDTSDTLVQVEFGDRAREYFETKDKMDALAIKVKRLSKEMEADLVVAGLTKVMWNGRPVQIIESCSAARVDPAKLLSMGVDADIIAACTEAGKPYQYVKGGDEKETKS